MGTPSRYYSSTAGRMALVGAITSGAATLVVDTTVGLPVSLPFTLLLDPGAVVEEVVEVTTVGGTTLTITRAVDGTSAQAHLNGIEVRHAYSARDFQDSRNHEANTTTAHGVTGAVVGSTNAQSLTNKTLVAPVITGGVGVAGGISTDTVTASGNSTVGGALGVTGASTLQAVTATTVAASGAVSGSTGTFSGNVTAPNLTAGAVEFWPFSSPPAWGLLCNGAAVSRTTYAALFALFLADDATLLTYGVGDGSTTFNLPSFNGKVPVGYDSTQAEFNALGKTGGAKTTPAHGHPLSTAGYAKIHFVAGAPGGRSIRQVVAAWTSNVLSNTNFNAAADSTSVTYGTPLGGATDDAAATAILQPFVVLNYIIRF